MSDQPESKWSVQDWPRLALTGGIMGLFYYALIGHYSNGLEETLKNVVMLSVGYWLGSSKGAQSQTENISKALDLAATPTSTDGAGKAADDVASAAVDKANEIKDAGKE